MEKIEKDLQVSLHYILKEGSSDGPELESTYQGNPVTFTYGVGQMIPGFEANLEGLSQGDQFNFLLQPGDAYGGINHDAVVEVPLKNFKNSKGEIDENAIAIGQPVRMKNQKGQSFQGKIKARLETAVKVDFNHPMAGKTLHFSGEILSVRNMKGLD